MKLPRRKFLQIAAGAAALPALPRAALAEAYPSRPVHVVVGFPAGQTADISTRLVGDFLSQRLGAPFVIDNKPGAASTIATEFVVRAPPDGYTLLATVASNLINATLYNNLPYDFIRDIEPVASVTRTPLVLEVHPSLRGQRIRAWSSPPTPVSNLQVRHGLRRHRQLNHHGEAKLLDDIGTKLTHVPYRGSAPAVTDLIAGQVQVMFDLMGSSIEQIKAGRLRALGLTTVEPIEALPGVPAIAKFVPGYEAYGLGGIGAPKGTPREIVTTLNAAINAAIFDPRVKARHDAFGSIPLPGTPEDFRKLIASEIEKWGKVIKFAGIKPDKV